MTFISKTVFSVKFQSGKVQRSAGKSKDPNQNSCEVNCCRKSGQSNFFNHVVCCSCASAPPLFSRVLPPLMKALRHPTLILTQAFSSPPSVFRFFRGSEWEDNFHFQTPFPSVSWKTGFSCIRTMCEPRQKSMVHLPTEGVQLGLF